VNASQSSCGKQKAIGCGFLNARLLQLLVIFRPRQIGRQLGQETQSDTFFAVQVGRHV
jgi:hypothetical protein